MFDTQIRKIYITSSNSRFLSKEIATEPLGRTMTYTVYPLSFSEYLDFHQTPKVLHPQKNRHHIIHLAKEFLKNGGFPETTGMEPTSELNCFRITLM